MRWILALFSLLAALAADPVLRRAPSFSLPDSHQTQRDILDYRGKVLLIDFMQTTCPHCAKFSATLEQAMKKYPGKVAVLSVVLPPDTLQGVADYISKNGVTSPVLLDCGQMAGSYLRITSSSQGATVHFPHVFVIDPNGMIRGDYEYNQNTAAFFDSSNQLFNEVDKLLGSKK